MIISASRRTDIPTYYGEWFARRIREGSVCVRNPMNPHQVSRISLSRDVVDCIVFWTKNPSGILPYLDELDDYMYYFQFSLTGYGRDIERNVPDKKKTMIPLFRELSERIGKERVIWRYDPILINNIYTMDVHRRAFAEIAHSLAGYTEKCVISFVDVYQKNKGRMQAARIDEPPAGNLRDFAGDLCRIAGACGMKMTTCAEGMDLSDVGIEHNSCIDQTLIERLTGGKLDVKKDPAQRPECGCVAGIDIGAYNTCTNGCAYCYATFQERPVEENRRRYDPDSPILCDTIGPDDRVTERKVKSLLDRQMKLPGL